MVHRYPLSDQRLLFNDKSDKLRWFMLPSEAQDLLLGTCQKVKNIVPFSPSKYGGTRNNSLGSESPSESVTVFSKSFPPLLDVSSSQGRHNSLTSFEPGHLKRSNRFVIWKSGHTFFIDGVNKFLPNLVMKIIIVCMTIEAKNVYVRM